MSWELLSILVQVFCTLAIFSFLYKDNPVYKFAEHLFVGVATGWWIVLEYRDVFRPNLFEPLRNGWTVALGGSLPEGIATVPRWPWLHVPLLLGLLIFMRLSPRATYMARWSMAVIVGTYAGLAIIGFGSGDLFNQIRSNVIPFFAPGSWSALVADPGLHTVLEWLRNPVLVVGLLTVLVYFFFSVPHRGAVAGVATVGIWFLMVSFGASYGNTVMARISLFIGRATFLLVEQTQGLRHAWVTLALTVVIILLIAVWERRQGSEDAAA